MRSLTRALVACCALWMFTGCSDPQPTQVLECADDQQDNDGDGVCRDACSSATCGGHGTCSDTTGRTVCACTIGYAGADCSACARHYQDDDGDGTCDATCGVTSCNSHGDCDTSSGTLACICDEGFAGATCDTCANGFQDNDGNGTCEPECDVDSCSGHGTCNDASGATVCTCDAAYDGAKCDGCADGFQDRDGDATCEPACGDASCSSHGACDDTSGTIACTCTPGYEGDACDECEDSHQDNDTNGTCEPKCTVSTCSGHGQCDDASGEIECECDAGFSGALCTGCAGGLQDNDTNGTCEVACGVTSCSSHGACDDAGGSIACDCGAGYVGDDCSVCDDGFQDNDDDGICEPSCDDSTCGDHATCDDADGTARCTCSAAYEGGGCNACADGFQDNDTNGTCEPECSASSCSAHGTCVDTSGSIECTCEAGRGGDDCEFRRVYGVSLPASGDINTVANVPYDVNETATTMAYDRIAYHFQLDGNYVWAEMDAFTDVPTKLGVPVDWIWDGAVSNLTVRTNASNVTEVTNASTGRMEFWSHCMSSWPFGYDEDDTPAEHQPDCMGSMAVYAGKRSIFGYHRWSSNTTADVAIGDGATSADTISTANAGSYTTRRLDVYVRDVSACASNPCAHGGTCDDSSGVAVCTCPVEYTGTACKTCASGYSDDDHDGVCEATCGGGTCDGLDVALGLPTGVHDFTLASGETPLYVDGDYDGGGWILIGRGRDGWVFGNDGQGDAATVKDGVGTSAAFDPRFLSTTLVQRLISQTVGTSVDARDVEIRLRRAANLDGSAHQEVRWKFTTQTTWSWQFQMLSPQVTQTVYDSILGTGGTATVNTQDAQPSNDHRRVMTYNWDSHGGRAGFGYGTTVTRGINDPSVFLWEFNDFEGHSIPYTEVYVRIRRCGATECNPYGTCDDTTGEPFCVCDSAHAGTTCSSCSTTHQDNDTNGSCTATCATTTCNAGEGCVDLGGTAQCLPASYASCLEILVGDPAAPDGYYAVDPDGAGALPAVGVECDMTNGGWTTVSFENFSSGYATGWSSSLVDTTSTCSTLYGRMLGGYGQWGNINASKTYALGSIPHTETRVDLNYYVFDSWDNEQVVIRMNGTEYLRTAYTGGAAPANLCGATNFNDHGAFSFTKTITSSTDSLLLNVQATINETATNESLGVDNIRIRVR